MGEKRKKSQFGVMNKSTTVNIFVLHTLPHNITHLAVITRKSNIKLGILKRGETGKEPNVFLPEPMAIHHASFQKHLEESVEVEVELNCRVVLIEMEQTHEHVSWIT